MLLTLLRYIRGYLKIRVTGESPERFLNACGYRGIFLWGISFGRRGPEMCIRASDFRKLKPMIRSTGVRVEIIGRRGLPFWMFRCRRRKLFFAGAAAGFSLIFLLSLFLWGIDVQGNRRYTDEALLAFLRERGVACGMRLSSVDCDRIVKDIRKAYDGIIWVSASVNGCRLTIRVKENEDSDPALSADETAESGGGLTADGAAGAGMDLVASQDGVIREMIVRKGLPCVQIGDSVEKGQILVTGAVPVVNDAGEITGYQMQRAEAKIRGRVSLEYSDSIRNICKKKIRTGLKKEEQYIRIGGYMLWIGDGKNPYPAFEEISQTGEVLLPGGFKLPLSWGSRVWYACRTEKKKYREKELRALLSEEYCRFQENLVKKGVEIIGNDVKIYRGPVRTEARGTLTVVTDIGAEEPSVIPQDSMVEDTADGND